MKLYTRSAWKPRGPRGAKDGLKPEGYVHHTVTSNKPINTHAERCAHMRRLEDEHLSRGYSGIGYNFVVFPRNGNLPPAVFEGRGWDRVPAAQYRHNTGTLAVAVVGNFEHDTPDFETLSAIADVFREGRRRGHPLRKIDGHRAVYPTACPGRHLYARLTTIRALVARDGAGSVRKIKKWQRSLRINRARLHRILDGRAGLRAAGKEDTARYRYTTRAMNAAKERIRKLGRLIARELGR